MDSAKPDAGSGGTSASGGSASGGKAGTGLSAGMGGRGSAGEGATEVDCEPAEPGEMVEVDEGSFEMGCNEELDDECSDDELPQHEVTLAAFEIDVTEVTQGQYAACVADGDCVAPSCDWDCRRNDYPATCIDWKDAAKYCAWAGKRLPTEAEWEKAARGRDGRKYPWGNEEPDCSLANLEGCGDELSPVGSVPDGVSPYGALDMAGNVVELVADVYASDYYAESPSDDPTGPTKGERYSGRGGGFKSESEWQRASKRDWYDVDDRSASLGFRCAR